MDESKLGEQMARGARAAQIVHDEIFVEAIDSLKSALIARWLMSPDRDERERIWTTVHLVDQMKQGLVTMISNGHLAQHQLDELTAEPRPTFNVV